MMWYNKRGAMLVTPASTTPKGMLLMYPQINSFPRFWSKAGITSVSRCWLWKAYATTSGYGQISLRGRPRYAHRLAYELVVGPIPDGLQLDHLCRVRRCVNPAHLEPVSNRDNILRGISPHAINARKTHCPQGHPYSGDNLLYRALTRAGRICNMRRCRTCRRAHERARRKAVSGA